MPQGRQLRAWSDSDRDLATDADPRILQGASRHAIMRGNLGAWPSGKARDFGSRDRRFESYRPSFLIMASNLTVRGCAIPDLAVVCHGPFFVPCVPSTSDTADVLLTPPNWAPRVRTTDRADGRTD